MKDIDPKFQEYIFEASGTLGFFQLIEEFLKLYIEYSFKHAAVYLSGKMPFRFTGEEFENAPLERLLITFRKLNNNDEVIGALEKLKAKRNFCAHRAFVWYFENPEIDEGRYRQKLELIKEIKNEAIRGFLLLFTEVSKLDERIMGEGQ
ncbi:MAG: hypothetical protein V1925_02425 [Candidatus Omnitrophota bacterium]